MIDENNTGVSKYFQRYFRDIQITRLGRNISDVFKHKQQSIPPPSSHPHITVVGCYRNLIEEMI
jgi:hypothetical protein